MTTAGKPDTFVAQDEWTVQTQDESDGAHWEHSIAVLREGVSVLTAFDGGAKELAEFGIAPVNLD
jgi:methionyl aminopeptidase